MISRCGYVLALILLLELTGCSGVCTSSGVEGAYELSVGGASYALQLRASGQGTLSVSGKAIGDLHWALNNASDQQILELNATGAVYAALSKIAPRKGGPTSPVLVSAGVFGPAPECNWKGRMTKLVLDYDERIEFHRYGS